MLPAAGVPGSGTEITLSDYAGHPAFVMDNGLVELIAVPRFNRILSLRLKPDGENLLWNSMEEVFAGWRNYGGSKLLPAPQSAWPKGLWPPHPEPDQLPGTHEFRGKGLLLRMPDSPHYGIRFERLVMLAESEPEIIFQDTMINVSDRPQRWAIREIIQFRNGGEVMIPDGRDGAVPEIRGGESFRPGRETGRIKLAARRERAKAFISSPAGGIGCRLGGVTAWHTLSPEQPVLPRPAGEAPFSIYYCRKYFEVEMVGPEWTLSRGESKTLVHRRRLERQDLIFSP